jgi:hypothetical protein
MRRINLAVLLVTYALLAGCRAQTSVDPRSSGPPRLLTLDDLSAAEKRYGLSATRTSAVTYQPDVVIPTDGANAIRAVSPEGFVWTLDPDADGARDIQPGRVLLLTSRAVGRVLAVEKASDGLRVVLGPVDITEVIRDGQFNMNQPVDFTQALVVERPEIFDPVVLHEPLVARVTRPDRSGMFVMPVALMPASSRAPIHPFKLTPLIGPKGVGVEIVSNGDGLRFLGQAFVYLNTPSVNFVLDIRGGKVLTAELALSGVGGLLMGFQAGLPRPTDANINAQRFAANDYSIPIGGVGGVPLAVNVRQQFLLRTAFTSSGTLNARGHYAVTGALRMGYRDGKFTINGPGGFDAKETILPSIQGVAIGTTGMVMTHHVSVIVGIGSLGFVAGPYAYLNSGVTATRSSSVGLVNCRWETVSSGAGAGVGYQMPEPVTDAINAFLSALNIKQRIRGSGGIESKQVTLANKGWYNPPVHVCKG